MRQVSYLRAHYQETPAPMLAAHFGITLGQLYDLAHRHGIRKRAPNGAPEWRQAA